MPFPGLTFAELLDNATREELEQFVALLEGWLRKQHKHDGSHGAITADSLTAVTDSSSGATGAVTAGGAGTFGGDVIANSEETAGATTGAEASLRGVKSNSSSSGPALQLGYASDAKAFALIADYLHASAKRLRLHALAELSSEDFVFQVSQDPASAVQGEYYLTPGATGKLFLGGPLAAFGAGYEIDGLHVAEVNLQTVNTGVLAPAQITADQNNYAPTGIATATTLGLTSDAARTITGINATQAAGRVLYLLNGGSFTINLAHDSASSTATNRILCPGAATLAVRAGGGVTLVYTGTRWVAATP